MLLACPFLVLWGESVAAPCPGTPVHHGERGIPGQKARLSIEGEGVTDILPKEAVLRLHRSVPE